MISNIPLLGKNAPLVETFKLPRGYFPIKYRFAGFDYKDLEDFTNLTVKQIPFSDPLIRPRLTESNYFDKPFTQEFIDFVLLNGYDNTETLKTYYGITVTAGVATPNGAGTGISVDAPTLAAMSVWLLARYNGEKPNFDMTLRVLVSDLMKDANANYTYPPSGIIEAIREAAQKLKEFALITKSDPVRIKSIKFSDVGGNSRKQYEENMVYFQTEGDRQIKQTIKPNVGISSKDKNLEILTITPTREMILDNLRDLDVSVIGNESFLTIFLQERQNAITRIKNFLERSNLLIFFNAPGRPNGLILPFTPPPVLNLDNGVGITLMFEKVRPDFVSKPRKRLAPAPTPTFALAPVVTPVPTQEQIKLSSFDEIKEVEKVPKSTNNTPIIGAIVVLLVSLIAFLLVKE